MMIHKPSNTEFANRKQAIQCMGRYKYLLELSKKNFKFVNNNQYVTTNGLTSNAIENQFSWFKRGFGGTITHCRYIQLYLNEYAFRYNTRNMSTVRRFEKAVEGTIGRCVTYQQIRDYSPYTAFMSKRMLQEIEDKKKRAMKTLKLMFEIGIVDNITYKKKKYKREDFIK